MQYHVEFSIISASVEQHNARGSVPFSPQCVAAVAMERDKKVSEPVPGGVRWLGVERPEPQEGRPSLRRQFRD